MRDDGVSERGSPTTHNEASGVVHGPLLQVGSIVGDVVLNAPGWSSRIDEWTEGLAQGVRKLWRQEEAHRRVHDPVALPVRWHPAAPELADHWANVRRLPAGATGEPLALAGRVEHLEQVYRSIPSGRLVILGPAGAGKTVLAGRLALDLLDARGPGQPVPVIVSAGSWNPETTPLHGWLAEQITRDHPGLAVPVARGGPTRAGALIDAGRVLPVLDGFDELDVGLHQAALRRLNASPDAPAVITSRTAEYAAAVRGVDALTAAAVVELDDLSLDDLHDYLPRTTAGDRTGLWDPVLERMRTEPHAPGPAALCQVLTNPLMVFLARTIYSDTPGRDPAELLATDRFPTAAAVRDHLLAAFVPAVYQDDRPGRTPRWPADRARHYLAYLAGHLREAGTRDLAWWQLRDTVPRRVRTRLFALLDGLLIGFAVGLAPRLMSGTMSPLSYWLSFGLAAAAASGVTVALTVRLTRRSRGGRRRGKATVALTVGFAVALVFVFVFLLILVLLSQLPHGPWYPSVSIPALFFYGLKYGLPIGAAAGLVAVLVGDRTTGPRPTGTRLQLRGRARFIASRFVLGYVAGLVIVVALWFWSLAVYDAAGGGFTGPVVAVAVQQLLVGGLLGALAFGLVAAATFGLEAPLNAADAVRAADSLARDRRNTVRKVLAVWLMVLPVGGIWYWMGEREFWLSLSYGEGDDLITAVMVVVVGMTTGVRAISAWAYWLVLVRGWLPLTGRLPWRVQAFLTDAYQRGVLRQTGAVYQFRHARLQDHLLADPTPPLRSAVV
ncbi:NACHT domain-containing protein [Actinophytocola xanthii]|uniref:NACHT domain-containing protein n=1 Tax=Actinophytocola xanthii TaxID=1912961 RepID=UPI000ADCF8C3|nr:NACHT domain-containing protein [Actinophytocola xanthii]